MTEFRKVLLAVGDSLGFDEDCGVVGATGVFFYELGHVLLLSVDFFNFDLVQFLAIDEWDVFASEVF